MCKEDELKRQIKKLKEKLFLMSKVLKYMNEGVVIVDKEGRIKSANEAFLDITGLKLEGVYGTKLSELDLKWEGYPSFQEVMDILLSEGLWKGEVWGVHRGGRPFSTEATIVRADEDNYVVIFLDTTDKRSLEANLRSLAYYDSLTGLPNRALLYEHISQLIFHAREERKRLAVIFIDIDNFKLINDTLGHDVGDNLLKAFAQRLTSYFPKNTMVARFGSDEFVVVLDTVPSVDFIEDLVAGFVDSVSTPFFIEKQKIYITVTAGISIYPIDGNDPQTLLRNADIAMHHAKELGKSSYKFFTNELNLKVSERFTLQAELRDALEKEEFALYYQPQFELHTNSIVGVEALIRWHHPDRGVILPGRFMPVVEDTDLIIPLGYWVLKKACEDGKRLVEEGFPLKIAVNISAKQLSSENFLQRLKDILNETGFSPEYLEMEITESVLMKNKQQAADILRELKKLGISIAIDDFGTSYSSLNYLKYFPVDKLKIDRSFIGDVISDPNDVAIATTIIAIAHNLGLRATAEGVETEEQLIFLKLWQCDEAQGFYFSPPVTLDSLIDMLKSENFKIKGV
ncbi:PAS domain S-box-containing protein/diguanylate cyclase (GGDEF)-like protein [Hydrogenivirga caldilitoris]|uniref:PAS domain S-box-containing protein/diguanylate cyclase (GGDEF)-like protein n=1 Tax=Hydrogenivirga caldilitoris TaxID=246264 RepID=A0A497XRI3_9AQUI|nr:EAL domain-containing protein [Hydrogenivirga caldilitoris]RLJ71615.1 PAS domain S-box-containing protein/diguanylate cyclase (GGDEF)-like protein [Hydrogenivirga caldilitoris]